MQELGAGICINGRGVVVDEAQAQMDVAEQAALVRLLERRPRHELGGASDVVKECGGEQQVGAEPRVQLGGLAADRGDADRVFEQSARVRVVRRRGGQPPQQHSKAVVGHETPDRCTESGVRDLACKKLEEAVQLVDVTPKRRRKRRRIGVRSCFEDPYVDLKAIAETLDPPEHADRVAFREARVEQLDVLPNTRVDATARIDELQCEVRCAAFRPQPLLAGDRVDPFDDAFLGKFRDRAHPW